MIGVWVVTLGKKLRNLRQKERQTLKEQSKIFDVSLNSIYRWEHDITMPKNSTLLKIAEFYDVSLDWLLAENPVEDKLVDSISHTGSNEEQQLLSMFRKFSDSNKYRVLGYVEHMIVNEDLKRNEHPE